MAGPETLNPPVSSDPQTAVAYLAPKNYEQTAAAHREPFFTPEHDGRSYNVHDPVDAEAYLINVHGRDLPKIRGEFDATTGYHLAFALRGEKRAAIYENGEHENDAEHSFFLTIAASYTASEERRDLDAGKVAFKAAFHDLVSESYGGDTPINDKTALETKEFREAASLTLFLQDVGDGPLRDLMLEYENELTPEDRFVKGMDKVVAYQFSLATRAALHRIRGEKFEDLVTIALPKAIIDHTAFKKMKGVLKELGRKWSTPGWDCIPFEGDPDEIVERIASSIRDQGAEVIQLDPPTNVTNIEQRSDAMAEIKAFPIKSLVEVVLQSDRQVIEPEVLSELGIAVMSAHRSNQKPEPPTPTGPAAFAIAA